MKRQIRLYSFRASIRDRIKAAPSVDAALAVLDEAILDCKVSAGTIRKWHKALTERIHELSA